MFKIKHKEATEVQNTSPYSHPCSFPRSPDTFSVLLYPQGHRPLNHTCSSLIQRSHPSVKMPWCRALLFGQKGSLGQISNSELVEHWVGSSSQVGNLPLENLKSLWEDREAAYWLQQRPWFPFSLCLAFCPELCFSSALDSRTRAKSLQKQPHLFLLITFRNWTFGIAFNQTPIRWEGFFKKYIPNLVTISVLEWKHRHCHNTKYTIELCKIASLTAFRHHLGT